VPEIDQILGLSTRQRDYLQQRFKYHVEKFATSDTTWQLVHEWLGADLEKNLGLPPQLWQQFVGTLNGDEMHAQAGAEALGQVVGCRLGRPQHQRLSPASNFGLSPVRSVAVAGRPFFPPFLMGIIDSESLPILGEQDRVGCVSRSAKTHRHQTSIDRPNIPPMCDSLAVMRSAKQSAIDKNPA
jgi:hypothetical protein